MEAGFYGDTGRVIVFFYEVKQRTFRLVPGWVTAVLDFVKDPVSRYIAYINQTCCLQQSCGLHITIKHAVYTIAVYCI